MIYNLPSGKKLEFPKPKDHGYIYSGWNASVGYKNLNKLVDALNGKIKLPRLTEWQQFIFESRRDHYIKRHNEYKAFMQQFTDAGHEVWDLYRNDEPWGFNLKDLAIGIYWNSGRGKRPHELLLPWGKSRYFKTMAQFKKIMDYKTKNMIEGIVVAKDEKSITIAPLDDNIIAKNLYLQALKK